MTLKVFFFTVRRKEYQLFVINLAHSNLVVTKTSIQRDKINVPTKVTEILYTVRTPWDRVFKKFGDSIQRAVADTKAPYKVVDVSTSLLVRFRYQQ